MSTRHTDYPIEVTNHVSWSYPTQDGELHIGNWGPEFDDKAGAFMVSLSLDELEHPNVPQVSLTVTQVRALIERLDDVIADYEHLVPVCSTQGDDCA